ncbi:hypothetical protein C6N40_13620 [Arenimonas caeni]|uniref:Uncharacterized protein n=1 Tax=Arenimonas caeni TaxID=2058085 RepID=A0A2P6M5F9_9GAMM|nr:hypothetical protein C6N40_13620 [Arenimonas caeni]
MKVGCDDLAQYFESIDLNEVLRDINEDRSVAGFPLLNDLDPLEDELAKLRRAYVQSMVQALDRLPSSELVEVVTELVEEATSYGVEPASALIGDLVEVYERRVGGFLESEAEDIEKLIDATKARAEEGAEAGEIDALTTRILERAQHWDEKAQPVQVLMESRGLEHRVSVRLALALRGLAIELFNEHDYLNISKRISDRLREIFAEVPEIAERVEQDIEALVEIADARRNEAVRSKKEQEEFAASIAYEATFGLLIKDTFRLSTNGVSWKGSSLSLEEVDGISWGGLRGDYKTTFDVRIYSPRGTLFVEFSDESKFGPMIERLWKAVGVRLLIELLQTLRSGAVMTFGGMRISDRGVVIPVERMFRATQEVFVPWGEARKSSQGGQLVLTSGDGKAKGSIDLRQSKNSPVLSTALDIYWKKGGSTLSSILGK